MDQLLAAKAANVAIKVLAKRVSESTRATCPAWCIHAHPYLQAIRANDYGLEDPVMCVLYALNNMIGWKGPIAREVKEMLNESIKGEPDANKR